MFFLIDIQSLNGARTVGGKDISYRFLSHIKNRTWAFQDIADDIIKELEPMEYYKMYQISYSIYLSLKEWMTNGDPEVICADDFYVNAIDDLVFDTTIITEMNQCHHIIKECMELTLKELVCWTASGLDTSFKDIKYTMF